MRATHFVSLRRERWVARTSRAMTEVEWGRSEQRCTLNRTRALQLRDIAVRETPGLERRRVVGTFRRPLHRRHGAREARRRRRLRHAADLHEGLPRHIVRMLR